MPQYSGVFTLPQQAQALTSGQWCTDPYFKNTTLLLHADGIPGGAQNNTFLDSSSNAFTITRNGNTTQGAFSPYMPNGYWSNYFDGVGDQLSFASNAAFQFESGNFTIEWWMSASQAGNSGPTIWSQGTGSGGGGYFNIHYNLSAHPNKITVWMDTFGVGPQLQGVISSPEWTHVALVRNGSTFTLFINGTATSTYSNAGALNVSNYALRISESYTGYLSNYRVVKGTAVYTSNFTPSATPLTAISGTSLLTCQSNRFLDNSTNAFTPTITGNPSVQQFQPFMRPYQYSTSVIGGSGYFDGTGDYLTAGSSISLSGDLTVEAWVYAVSWGAWGGIYLYGLGTDSTSSGATFFLYQDGGIRIYTNGSNKLAGTSGKFTLNEWVHVAWVRSSGTVKSYVNGIQIDSASWSSTISGLSHINAELNSGTTYPGGACYISNLRVVTSAVYTSNFTPPTAPLTAITNTQLLCNFTNAGIYDNAMQNNLETVGNAQVSTSVVKYGSGSMYFDGSGDYLITPSSSLYTLGSSAPFTIEGWFYLTASQTTDSVLLSTMVNWSSDYVNRWAITATGTTIKWYNSAGSVTISSAVSSGQWVHIAVCNTGSTITMYINGASVGTQTTNLAYTTDGSLKVGGGVTGAANFNGYIDDLRITKGVARYTSNFQPPQVAFANQ